jgi:hypothetical protein
MMPFSMKIRLKAKVLDIEQPTSNENIFRVAFDCGQPLKTCTTPKIAPQLMDIAFSRPAEGFLIMQVLGQPIVNVGDLVDVEIEPL